MNYSIVAKFPSNRETQGTLEVLNSMNKPIFGPVPALGRGTNDKETNGDNHNNWKLINADTPTGEYETSIDAANPDVSTYGPYKLVRLDPAISGDAKIAQDLGRKGFLIHGGDLETNTSRTWYPLRPTLGCIRISNENQQKLIEAIEASGGGRGKVTISNY
ncbi:L,D-transpeptidase [Paenibacillus amylolyticus]|uniref:L,D-transpeptidase n=1 Tax=Paenibacillus amylolyticus TaxID=1451 RepID=UPI0033950C4F